MAWIGIECGASVGELAMWGGQLRRMGAPESVCGMFDAAIRLLSGAAGGVNAEDRMRDIESRASAAAERKRADVMAASMRVIARVMGDGVDPRSVMAAIKKDGWRGGAAGGVCSKNGGVRRRKSKAGADVVAGGAEGGVVAVAQRGVAAPGVIDDLRRRRTYGESWEGWCGVVLRDRGFKMTHVAKALGVDVSEAWRAVSGWTRYWRAENLAGRVFPGPKPGWEDRMRAAVDVASNVGVKGARPVLNGTRDCGTAGKAGDNE